MNRNNCFAIIALLTGLFCASPVFGHDPGLSVVEISLSNNGLQARITFARRDIEVLVAMDIDHDGAVSDVEYTASYPRLQSLGAELLAVDIDARRMLPQSVDIVLDESDALHYRLAYANVLGSEFTVESTIIAKLRRGHRQYLVVKDQKGALLAQALLTSRKPQAVISPESTELSKILFHYLAEGVWHIFIGIDHVLFLLTLMLPAVLVYRQWHWQSIDRLRPATIEMLKIVTAFSLAHSITLSLAVLEVITLPQRWVESAIALSVLLVALNNLKPVFSGSRWWLAFVFGLVHGFGFANVLLDLGLSKMTLAVSLIGFNLGVELGQVVIVLLLFPLAYVLRDTRLYRGWAFKGGSLTAAALASVWLLERAFDYDLYAF